MLPIERNNIEQIELLNQRGGRSLSIVDLAEAGTVSTEMAALAWVLVENGTSFLTGAVPGGAGKTTLMASLLGFMPAGERIVTAADADVVGQAAAGRIQPPFCLLAHEIGQGRWYAYIWGNVARQFFSVRGPGRRRVTCLHADTPAQAATILDACSVQPEDAGAIGMELFIRAMGSFRPVRRVTAMHCRLGGEMAPVYRWRESDDGFEALAGREELAAALAPSCALPAEAFAARWERCDRFLRQMLADGVRRWEDVRARVLAAAGAGG